MFLTILVILSIAERLYCLTYFTSIRLYHVQYYDKVLFVHLSVTKFNNHFNKIHENVFLVHFTVNGCALAWKKMEYMIYFEIMLFDNYPF